MHLYKIIVSYLSFLTTVIDTCQIVTCLAGGSHSTASTSAMASLLASLLDTVPASDLQHSAVETGQPPPDLQHPAVETEGANPAPDLQLLL